MPCLLQCTTDGTAVIDLSDTKVKDQLVIFQHHISSVAS